jgi:clan AA aspartic protease (TIGR02281 family)
MPKSVLEVELIGTSARCRIDMALDTGATFTMVPWDVAERLGYDPAGSTERIVITTASTIERAPVITLEQMRALDVEVADVKVVVHDLPPKSRVDGLLGLSFLKHFDINLYFKKGSLEFKDP